MPRITVIVPTLNEQQNVEPIFDEITRNLSGVDFEVLFVDDHSSDGTIDKILELQKTGSVRLILRVDRSGLSSAILDGLLAASSPVCAVVDADLQHELSLLPRYLTILETDQADVVIGTRYGEGGDAVGLADARRRVMSSTANALAQLFLPCKVSDPMSGTFAVKREHIFRIARKIERVGYKILFDILHLSPNARVIEVPYAFRARLSGESKLSFRNQWDFLVHMLFILTGRHIPSAFLSFALVGLIGAVFHFGVFFASLALGASFIVSHTTAVVLATIFNFTLNNVTTFASLKLKGARFLYGLFVYIAASSVGIALNIGAAQTVYALKYAPATLATLIGVAVDLVWKYTISSSFIWRR